jgi:mono/diheme cytochrome c family protein
MKIQNILVIGASVVLCGILMGTAWLQGNANDWNKETLVSDVLEALGAPSPAHKPNDLSPENIQRGRDLATTGYAIGPDGKRSRIQSRYFACTNCHLMDKEDPDLRVSDPEARLTFLLQRNLPFLQGTTMYGTYNKESWYNGDYEKKYGDWIKPARHSLEGAINLCATVCSQGRALEAWEMDAMKAYFWSISLKLGDLSLTESDWQRLKSLQGTGKPDPAAVAWLKSFYRLGSPATFVEAPEDKRTGYQVGRKGNPEVGKHLFVRGCMSCHGAQGSSKYLKLDMGKLSLTMFRNKIASNGYFSLYEIIRHGTHSTQGHRPYMPNYTAERMSNQQVEDLRAFVEAAP